MIEDRDSSEPEDADESGINDVNVLDTSLEAQTSRRNTATSKPETSDSKSSASPLSAQDSGELTKHAFNSDDGSIKTVDQEIGHTSGNADVVLLEGELDDDRDIPDRVLLELDEALSSCSEGSLDCFTTDVALGENPFASPNSSRTRAAAAVEPQTAYLVPQVLSSQSPEPQIRPRYFPQSEFQEAPRGSHVIEQQIYMGSPNPAQLHSRPYTPDKYSPEKHLRRIPRQSGAPQQDMDYCSGWAAGSRGFRDSGYQSADSFLPYPPVRQSSDLHVLSSRRGYPPALVNGYPAQHAAWEVSREWEHNAHQSRYLQQMIVDSRQRHPSDQGLSAGLYPAPCKPMAMPRYAEPRSHATTPRDILIGQHLHSANEVAAVQPSSERLFEVEDLQQELATTAWTVERDYLATITSLSARLEAAIDRETALRQRLSRAEAVSRSAAAEAPLQALSPPELTPQPSQSSAEAPVEPHSQSKAQEADGAASEPANPEGNSRHGEEKEFSKSADAKNLKQGREAADSAALQASLEASQEMCRDLERQLGIANKRLDSTAMESRKADVEVSRLRKANTELGGSLARAQAEIPQLLDQLREDARALKEAERQRQQAELEALSLGQALDAARRAVAARDQDFARLQQNLHSARAELSELHSRYRQLERSSLMSQPAVVPAGQRAVGQEGSSPLLTSRQEGALHETRPPSPSRRRDASLPGVATATRGFIRGPPTSLVFPHDSVPRLPPPQQNGHYWRPPKAQSDMRSGEASPTTAPGPSVPRTKLPDISESGRSDEGHIRMSSPQQPPPRLENAAGDEQYQNWRATSEESFPIRDTAEPMSQSIAAESRQAPQLGRLAAGLPSSSGQRVTEQQRGAQQPSAPHSGEQIWVGNESSSPLEAGLAATKSNARADIQGKLNGAVGLSEEASGPMKGPSGSTFRPYATDMSLQDFVRHQKALEERLLQLNEENQQMEAEYARMPAVSAGRTLAERRRRAQVEATLEANKREASNLRLQLKRLGLS